MNGKRGRKTKVGNYKTMKGKGRAERLL